MIVEVACIRLESKDLPREQKPFLHDAPYDKRQATLRFTLTRGIRILNRISKYTFHLLQDTEDPSLVYYIGRWGSLACYTGFRASADREELISALRLCEASLAWHEISEAQCSRPRKPALRLSHGHTNIFAAPLVGIARCHTGAAWANGGGSDVDWVLSCTRKHPTLTSLVCRNPLVKFRDDALLSSTSECNGGPEIGPCLIVGEWKTGERERVRGEVGYSQLRCADVDLRILSPIHLH